MTSRNILILSYRIESQVSDFDTTNYEIGAQVYRGLKSKGFPQNLILLCVTRAEFSSISRNRYQILLQRVLNSSSLQINNAVKSVG
jgi:hypothetical protein